MRIPSLAVLVLVPTIAGAQPRTPCASGPATGSSERFGRVSPADLATIASPVRSPARAWRPELEAPDLPDPPHLPAPAFAGGTNETDDRASASESPPVLTSFPGLSPNAVVPADPILAAGPDHILVTVNSAFAIYSKSGASLFQTTAGLWFLPQLPALGEGALLPYDPQVAYDHFRGRWILLYAATDAASQSWILLSVSTSSDPTAPWHSWALPGDRNGNTPSGNFSDFPALGFDDTAVYIATNQYAYSSRTFAYAKVRVLRKDALYAGANPLEWSDFWNLEDPAFPSAVPRSLRPARTFGSPGAEFLVSNSPFTTRTYVTLWSLTGAGTAAPELTAVNIPVTATTAPPLADQKGGARGTAECPAPCRLHTGSGAITSAECRDGSLWFSHTVADDSGLYSRARYVRLDLATRAPVQDEAFGSDGCWYFYPAVASDAGNNLVMVFGRSCSDEYAGIRFTARSTSDASLAPSVPLKDGEGSYVVPVGIGEQTNRWGDFFGAAVDPADSRRIWMVGEYAAARDTWGTWVGQTEVAGAGGCQASLTALCLAGGRFLATASWRKGDGAAGQGAAVPITADTGYFWFFNPENIEVVIKVLNACSVNGRYWVFAGGLTNVEVTLSVTDTQTGENRTYTNPLGTAFHPLQDTSAFRACAP
jgi:hypothetical protein